MYELHPYGPLVFRMLIWWIRPSVSDFHATKFWFSYVVLPQEA